VTTDQQKTQLQRIEIEDFVVLTDRDLSMLGEARHKTIGGRGVVGRLIDQSRPAMRRHVFDGSPQFEPIYQMAVKCRPATRRRG